MAEGITNNYSLNSQGPNPFGVMRNHVSTPVRTTTGTLERQPQNDNLELNNSNKQGLSKGAKLGIGAVTVLGLDSFRNTQQITNHNGAFRTSTNTYPIRGTNKVDKTPNEDTVEIGDKPKMSRTKKILLGIGAALVSALGIVYGVKKAQVKNIKNIQKSFREIFMRDDITVEQTREMMKRYKEIEKITDREEYAKALFEEVKKNYGMEKSNIKLVFEDKNGAAGFCKHDNSAISITPSCSRKRMLNTMHHEFRHAKQNELINHLDPAMMNREAFKAELSEIADEYIDKHPAVSLEDAMSHGEKMIRELRTKRMNEYFAKLDRSKMSQQEYEYIEKIKNSRLNHVDSNDNLIGYWNNFNEIDARKAGRTAEKYIRSKVFNFNEWLCDKLLLKSTAK